VFKVGPSDGSLWRVLPDEVESVTIYKSESLVRAWEALRSVASQLDALSAVVFGSVLKAALLPYGIENPENFLKAVGPDVATVKLRQGTDGSVLFARVLDRSALEQMFKLRATASSGLDVQHIDVSDREFAVTFVDEYFVIGPPDDVRIYLEDRQNGRTIADENRQTLKTFVPDGSSTIVTYASDDERIRNFFLAVMTLQGSSPPPTSPFANEAKLPYAMTETNLGDQGIERRTRSAFGQFSTLLALLRRN
jgi:hypothetical protein